MVALPLDRETIVRRIEGIEGELQELDKLGKEPFEAFSRGPGFKLAHFHLHRALEGVFHITGHILSRIPGAAVSGYKDMAKKLGETGIVHQDFANQKLMPMAGYRNRLVHFYAEITPQEMHRLLKEDLKDIEAFLKAVRDLIKNPQRFGLTLV